MSVGFSSWTISVGYTAQADLNLTVDRVVDINNYFEFAGEAKYFKYTSEGIAKDDVLNPSSETQEGDIEIPFQIKVGEKDSIGKHLPEGLTSLTLQTVLIDTNTKNGNFFDYCSYTATLYRTTENFSTLGDLKNTNLKR